MQQQRAALSAQGHSQGHHGAVSHTCTHARTHIHVQTQTQGCTHSLLFKYTDVRVSTNMPACIYKISIFCQFLLSSNIQSQYHTHTHSHTLLQCNIDAAVCPLLLQELTNHLVNTHTNTLFLSLFPSVWLDGFIGKVSNAGSCVFMCLFGCWCHKSVNHCRYLNHIYNPQLNTV